MTFTVWEYFVSVTWVFFTMAWAIRFASWAICAGSYWVRVALSSSPDEIENDN